jgi:hypothetical protein
VDDRSSPPSDPPVDLPAPAATVVRWWQRNTSPAARWLLLLVALALAFAAGAGVAANNVPVEVRTEYLETRTRTEKKVEAKAKKRTWKITVEPSGKRTEEGTELEVAKAETTSAESSVTSLQTVAAPQLPSWSVGVLAGATWRGPSVAPSAFTVGPTIDFRLGKLPCFAGGAALLEVSSGTVTGGTAALTGRCMLP